MLDNLLSLIASRAGEGDEQVIKNVNSEKPKTSAEQSETSTKSAETDAGNNKTEKPVEQDHESLILKRKCKQL